MLVAIQLHDELGAAALEINDEATYRRLATKREALVAHVTEIHPKPDFCVRQSLAQRAGEFFGRAAKVSAF